MNFGEEIIRDFIGEKDHLRGLSVLNIGSNDWANLNCVYGWQDGYYTQFFVLNCDEDCFIADSPEFFYEDTVYYSNRLYFFDFGLSEVAEHFKINITDIPAVISIEEERRTKKVEPKRPSRVICMEDLIRTLICDGWRVFYEKKDKCYRIENKNLRLLVASTINGLVLSTLNFHEQKRFNHYGDLYNTIRFVSDCVKEELC